MPAKYVAAEKQIRLGKPEDSTHGLQVLMGISGPTLGKIMLDPIAAIRLEFDTHGSDEDKSNFRRIFGGTFDGKTLEELVAHPQAKMAKLETAHVLALRLYTSSSYAAVNDPLRKDPPQRPHPFAATTYFIDQGIKMLRAVAASLPDAHTIRVYWRGMKDLSLTAEFM